MTEINRVEYLLKSFKKFNMFETLYIVIIVIVRFLRNFLSLIWEDFKAKGIVIHLDAGDDRNSVRADTRALHQVLLNIIGNAAEAMEERETPFIHISTHYMASTGTMNIIVRDNGQGIPQSQVKNLFKPFYTTKVEGTGLGLVIVKKILSRMEGEIAVSSVENKGTTVTISLPGAKLL
ncbi:MAG: GHKL domain-containing protein [bacterium]|nr:GHKL domain-containing protein [bacterium]